MSKPEPDNDGFVFGGYYGDCKPAQIPVGNSADSLPVPPSDLDVTLDGTAPTADPKQDQAGEK